MAAPRHIRNFPWSVLGLMTAVGCFYLWTAVPDWRSDLITKDGPGYYNLLARGFLKGQVSLDQEADPFLATLQDPTDPAQRAGHGLFDVSYFHGRYFLYWGVTPTVTLFVPFRLVTGRFLDESLASPLFACIGFVASVRLLRSVRRRYFPQTSSITGFACVLALGLANMMPTLLRRPSVYEVPITSGYACCMIGLVAIYEALHSRHRIAALTVASVMFGLAVGSRPLYFFSCAALLPILWHAAREQGLGFGAWRSAEWRRLALRAVLPLCAIGIAIAAYNYLRFGSPTDFGLRHQLTGDRITQLPYFGWRFLVYNIRVYGFAWAGWSPYFPFVEPAELPPYPAGNIGYEDPYGIIVNIPFVMFVAGLLFARRLGRSSMLFLSAALASAGTGVALSLFAAATNRYMVDFLPALVLLACFGLLVSTARFAWRGFARLFFAAVIIAVTGYSALFNIFASFVHNDLLRHDQPAIYRQLARIGNWPSHVFDRIAGTLYGPIEMSVRFPSRPAGTLEPLVVTGHSVLSDYLVVHYVGDNRIQFGLEHTSRGTFFGTPFTCQAGEVHKLRIDMGSLYPPRDHPYFDSLAPDEARLRQETLRVTFDGEPVLEGRLRFYDAAAREPSIGTSAGRPGFPHPFSGEISSQRRLVGSKLAPASPPYGAIRLKVRFPSFSGIQAEPLLSSGETGRGDLVYVRYEASGLISFGYDHWGRSGARSAAVSFDPNVSHEIEIDAGVLHPPAAGMSTDVDSSGWLVVRLDGKVVLDLAARYYVSPPYLVSVGFNSIEASTATSRFTGEILQSTRLSEPATANPR